MLAFAEKRRRYFLSLVGRKAFLCCRGLAAQVLDLLKTRPGLCLHFRLDSFLNSLPKLILAKTIKSQLTGRVKNY